MPENIESKLKELETKIDAVLASVLKIQRYFQIIFWVTIIMVVLPVIGLIFAIPAFINTYMSVLEGI